MRDFINEEHRRIAAKILSPAVLLDMRPTSRRQQSSCLSTGAQLFCCQWTLSSAIRSPTQTPRDSRWSSPKRPACSRSHVTYQIKYHFGFVPFFSVRSALCDSFLSRIRIFGRPLAVPTRLLACTHCSAQVSVRAAPADVQYLLYLNSSYIPRSYLAIAIQDGHF